MNDPYRTSELWPAPGSEDTECLDRRQPVGDHRGQDVDHLPIAVIGAGKLAPDTLHRCWQNPILEGSAIAQGTGLAGEHRHIVPGIVDRLAATEWTSRS